MSVQQELWGTWLVGWLFLFNFFSSSVMQKQVELGGRMLSNICYSSDIHRY